MSRALITLGGRGDRERAIRAIETAPSMSRVEIKAAKRTLPQNDRMWGMLTDIAQQKKHFGKKITTDTWKILFLHAVGNEVKFLQSLDGTEFIPHGHRSSDLTKEEMSDVIEFMFAWGAENGVVFHDDRVAAEAA